MSTPAAVRRGAPPVRVLYFTGTGRSGTTVINNILGQLGGAFACGELRYLWRRGVVENHLCGCGQSFATCPVWTAVMATPARPGAADRTESTHSTESSESTDSAGPMTAPVTAGMSGPEAQALATRLLQRLASRRVPAMLARRALGRPPVAPHPDDETIAWLYRAIADHVEGAVVIDSSKLPPYGMLLGQLPGIEVFHLHVVRDPRATAFSWQRSKPALDHAGGEALMPTLKVWKSAALWAWWNGLTVAVWGRDGHYLRVRYEDFVADPRGVIETVAQRCGLPTQDLPFETPTRVRMAPTHSVAGNPSRHSTGTVEIRSDDEWRDALPARDRRLVTALTGGVLRALGYSLRVRPARVFRAGRDRVGTGWPR